MKKIMFVGPVGVGKTTLTQRLKGLDISYHKTQAIQFHDSIIDTPGEFLQHRQYYNALTVTSAEADVIGLLVAATSTMQTFPQGFSSLFNKPVIGLVTKIDLTSSKQEIDRAKQELRAAGVRQIFELSLIDETGLEQLRQYLSED